MKDLTKKESKKEKKNFETLSKDELTLVRGGDGDQTTVGNGDDENG